MAFAELPPEATKLAAIDSLRRVMAERPHPVPTNNGISFGNRRHPPGAFGRLCCRVCAEHGSKSGFTQPGHPHSRADD